jgi:hypothetical protein
MPTKSCAVFNDADVASTIPCVHLNLALDRRDGLLGLEILGVRRSEKELINLGFVSRLGPRRSRSARCGCTAHRCKGHGGRAGCGADNPVTIGFDHDGRGSRLNAIHQSKSWELAGVIDVNPGAARQQANSTESPPRLVEEALNHKEPVPPSWHRSP